MSGRRASLVSSSSSLADPDPATTRKLATSRRQTESERPKSAAANSPVTQRRREWRLLDKRSSDWRAAGEAELHFWRISARARLRQPTGAKGWPFSPAAGCRLGRSSRRAPDANANKLRRGSIRLRAAHLLQPRPAPAPLKMLPMPLLLRPSAYPQPDSGLPAVWRTTFAGRRRRQRKLRNSARRERIRRLTVPSP